MHTTELTSANFENTVEKNGIVFIDWWASWCGPCRAFAPIYERVAAQHPDIVWGKIDTDAEQQLAGGFGIRSIPTLMVFRDGILIFEQPGMMNAMSLGALVDKVRALDMGEVKRRIAEHHREHAAEQRH
ncbi:MAG: thioredoxin family protein [Polyangiaceae bacterium]|nr:thioredoxin family protein [Polyangiaceae bacterium]MCE7893949.1 thioredoxin [Sorangiineae bacterium PRO1]MCL4755042.1 thioredoxin family protein [Myxococcales bacterium]